MERALITCPNESFFLSNLLVSKPTLPSRKNRNEKKTSVVEVEVLAVFDEKALIKLPRIMAREDNETALINVQYLD